MKGVSRAVVTSGALLLCLATVPTAQSPASTASSSYGQLAREIESLISSPGVSRGTWGIVARSLTTNDTLFAHNPRSLLVPASVAKLVSLAAAVDVVGWDYTFETSLRISGPIVDGELRGDLIVVGSGDPSIGGRGGDDFTRWIDALRGVGVTSISGRVVADDDAIEDPRPGAMWAWDDLGYTSGALFGALNYAENRLLLTVSPGAQPGAPTTVNTPSGTEDRQLVNRSVTGPPGSRPLLWPEQRPGEQALTIAGSLPVDSPPSRFFVSAGNPTSWFAAVLRRELERAGIRVAGGAYDIDDLEPKPQSAEAEVVYVHRSKTLAEIARPMLKDSINLYSEAVLRVSAGPLRGRTNDDALAALAEQLTKWQLPADGFQIVDGSGLSRRDTIAADALVGVLTRMYDDTFLSPWMSALPIAGRDGSLASRLRGSAAESNVRAKTGTMSNIRSLAGYLFTHDHEPVAFVIIVNNIEGSGQQAQAVIDDIVVRLANFSRTATP